MELIDYMKLKIAGVCYEVNALYGTTRASCAAYVSDEEAEGVITIVPEDIEFEREACMREALIEHIPYVERSEALLEMAALQRKFAERLFTRSTLLFHGSAIAVDGVAYLFTAKSGTGKSTHARLWRKLLGDRAVMINDDKPFLTVTDNGVTVYGSPWNGKHNLGTNMAAPLRAICILERGDQNRIERIRPAEAVRMLLLQSHRPQDPALMPAYMDLLDGIAGRVAFYRLYCNMEPEAASVSFEAMSRDENK